MSDPVFSRRDAVPFVPDGSPRAFTIAPLTFRERQAYRADVARECGVFPQRAQLIAALRAAIHEAAPGNAADLLADIDAAEATPEDADAQARLTAIEATAAEVPVYAALLAARERYLGTLPWVAARHTIRGWEGPGLPPFRRDRGVVPAALLDAIPDAEIDAIGWRAIALMHPGGDAEGNSGAPSPSPETPAPTTVA